MSFKARLLSRRMLPAVAVGATLALGAGVAVAAGGASPSAQPQASRACVDSRGASRSTVDAQHEESTNWAGYVVDSKSGQSFSAVSGSWKVPSVTAATRWGFSADWVGLGGSKQNSKALEQTGTTSDMVHGQPQYYAWSEIVPAPESKFTLPVHPGDEMFATVTVHGSTVTMSLSDLTTGHSVNKTERTSDTDTSSAEWIAEAPSADLPGGSPFVLPLADFGKVTFENAYAATGGRCGSISDPNWSVEQVQLSSTAPFGLPGARGRSVTFPRLGITLPARGDATPGNLSANGSSFSASYTPGGSTVVPSAPTALFAGTPARRARVVNSLSWARQSRRTPRF